MPTAIKFEKIQPGMTLYNRHKYVIGNTTMSSIGEWAVKIISVDAEKQTAVASWNSNPPSTMRKEYLEKLYTWSMNDKDVVVTRGMLGSVVGVRKMAKVEIAARDTPAS